MHGTENFDSIFHRVIPSLHLAVHVPDVPLMGSRQRAYSKSLTGQERTTYCCSKRYKKKKKKTAETETKKKMWNKDAERLGEEAVPSMLCITAKYRFRTCIL